MKMSDFPDFFNENFTQIHCFLIAMYSFLWFYSVEEMVRSGLGVSLDYCFSDPSASFLLPASPVASIFLSVLPCYSLFFMTISLTKSSCLLNESWAASSSSCSFFYFSFFFSLFDFFLSSLSEDLTSDRSKGLSNALWVGCSCSTSLI